MINVDSLAEMELIAELAPPAVGDRSSAGVPAGGL